MDVAYDSAKNAKNIRDRPLSFDRVHDLDWNATQVRIDVRHDYGEPRWIALGLLDGRLHVLVFTETMASSDQLSQGERQGKEGL